MTNVRKLRTSACEGIHSLAVDLETYQVYTPDNWADGHAVARMVVYEFIIGSDKLMRLESLACAIPLPAH